MPSHIDHGHVVMHVAHSGANSRSETIKTLRMTALDYRLLRLARCLLMQPDSPDHPFWKRAHQIAKEVFPIAEAALVVQSMRRITHHIEQSRQNAFLFVQPNDPHSHMILTPEERALVEFLHFQRKGNTLGAQTMLILLCEGGDGHALQVEAKKLCDILWSQPCTLQQKAS